MSQPTRPDSRFHAHDVALDLCRVVVPLIARIAGSDRDLARQLRRALPSTPMNLAEGRRRQGRDRSYHYTVAAGSADEVASALTYAEIAGYLDRGDCREALALIDRELAMLWRLTH